MVIKTEKWDRRRFIKAAGIFGAAGAVLRFTPLLHAAEGDFPKRLILCMSPNGTVLPMWRSNGSGAAFTPGEALPPLRGQILAPLDPFRDRVAILDGLDIRANLNDNDRLNGNNTQGHHSSCVLWTGKSGGGRSIVQKRMRPDGTTVEITRVFPNVASLDQIIAREIGGGSYLESVQITGAYRSDRPSATYSFGPGGVAKPAVQEPRSVYDTLFAGFRPPAVGTAPPPPPPDPTNPDRRARQLPENSARLRIAHLLRDDFERLRRELPADDRHRLEQHLEGVMRLEERLDHDPIGPLADGGDTATPAPGAATAECTVPDRPANTTDILRAANLHVQTITHALACDRTRVVAFTIAPEVSLAHGPSHDQINLNNDAAARTAANTIADYNRRYAQIFADLLTGLDSVQEGQGTMLDNSVLVWGQAMAHGGRHMNWNIPVVVAGGANSGLNLGRYYKFGTYNENTSWNSEAWVQGRPPTGSGRQAHNHLLVSIAQAFGLNVNTVGDTRFKGPLPGFNA